MAFLDLCRLCGTDTRGIVRNAIFAGEERHNKYALKIAECLTLQVTEEDELPKVMCGECTSNLDSLSTFRDKAFKTETHLLSRIHDLNTVKVELKADVDISLNLGHGETKNPSIVSLAIKQEIIIDDMTSDPITNIKFKKEFKEHLQIGHAGANDDGGGVDNSCLSIPKSQAREKIPVEGRSTTKRSSRELEEEAPPKKRGRKPKQTSVTTPAANPPTDDADWGAEQCEACHEPFGVRCGTQQHLCACVRVQPQRPPVDQVADEIRCSFKGCLLTFHTSRKMKAHLKVHFAAPHLTSDVCGRRFDKKCNLTSHVKRHTEFKPHACDHPGCTYAGKLAFDLHKHKTRTHTSATFTCQLCGKCIKKHQNYLCHVASHQTSTPGVFRCGHRSCKTLFHNGDDLRQHLQLTHKKNAKMEEESRDANSITRECQLCGKGFASEVKLRAHSLKHRTEEPGVAKCVFRGCKQTFASAAHLKEHAARHWGIPCHPKRVKEECGDQFNAETFGRGLIIDEEKLDVKCKEEIEEVVFD